MARRGHPTRKLLDEIAARPRVLVALDYDGTLVPTRARPDLARLGAETRSTLRRLGRGRGRVAIISGRSVADLRRQAGVPGIIYGGAFGLEIAGSGWRIVHPKARAMRRTLAGLVEGLRDLFSDLPGVRVEDKGVGLCVHYRGVAESRRKEFFRRTAHALAAASAGLSWRRGLFSREVLPRTDWDKGDAAEFIWRRLGRPYLLVIGDDRADEPMLRAARGRGAGIRVGRGSSAARLRLRDPDAVRRFLRALAERLDGGLTPRPGGRTSPSRPCP